MDIFGGAIFQLTTHDQICVLEIPFWQLHAELI